MENYKQYIKLMDSMTIHEELQKINGLHHSLNETNPMTYVILRETHKSKWTPSQLEWLDNQIDRLQNSIRENFENSLQSVDVELAQASILSKSSDIGEVRRID